jgi:Family of unknown function (DUF5682)
MSSTPGVHVLGIRHHGPGSARSLRRALNELCPDVVLVEGPPDADDLIPFLGHPEMKPPVALLIYATDQPRASAYYPFAAFSPEWQAIGFALENKVPVRFMDLPQTHQLLAEESESDSDSESESELEGEVELPESEPRRDPLRWLAEAAGFSDGERWWEHMVEHRRDGTDLFAAILEAMTALRDEFPEPPNLREARREAHMRQTIRKAQAEGFRKIAVVCGAWHAPALVSRPDANPDADAALLKGLPKAKVSATWVPWTHGRLSMASGYGAGVESPGWYHHLWQHSSLIIERWVTRIARLLRAKDLDASSAHVIETVRLAEALAALRGRPLPGLPELNEAVQAVLCLGDPLPMRLIHDALIVGETLGEVPAETPSVPLQQDLIREQKRLRLKPEAGDSVEDFDLRKPNDLDRSHLLHRLNLLGLPWGQTQRASGKKGTFHEVWRLRWRPEFAVALIEASAWGNTILDASTARARDLADHTIDLPALTELLDLVLLADLPDAVNHLTARLDTEAAVASDIAHLMAALPPLANVLRYGDVRKTDTTTIAHVVAGLVARICVNLPGACGSLDDDAAQAMLDRILGVDTAIGLLQNDEHRADWQAVLRRMVDSINLHGLIQGRCCRLLLDAGIFDAEEAARRLNLALSLAADPAQAATWIEGLLKGSGLILLHDQALWDVLDGWIASLTPDAFLPILPLIRRTFATFAAPERRQMGERARRGPARVTSVAASTRFDLDRAGSVLPLISMLLGVPLPPLEGEATGVSLPPSPPGRGPG